MGYRLNPELDGISDSATIGTNILRHGYFVFDLDDGEVSIAQVKYTKDSDIEEIESASHSSILGEGSNISSNSSTYVPSNNPSINSSNNDGSSTSASAPSTSSNHANSPIFVSFSMLMALLVMYGSCM